ATSGVTVAGGNGRGDAANQLAITINLWVDGQDTVYISGYSNDFSTFKLVKWAPGATSGVTIMSGSGNGNDPSPRLGGYIFMDIHGNLFLADINRDGLHNEQVVEYKRTVAID